MQRARIATCLSETDRTDGGQSLIGEDIRERLSKSFLNTAESANVSKLFVNVQTSENDEALLNLIDTWLE